MQINEFQNSFVKEMVRQLLVKNITERFPGYGLTGFTLPGDSFSFERQLMKYYKTGLSLQGVERDAGVYQRACDLIQKHKIPMDLHHEEDSDYWMKSNSGFNFVWLDYCGGWDQTKLDSILEIIGGDSLEYPRATPLLALTISGARESGSLDDLCTEVFDLSTSGTEEEHHFKARALGIPRIINREAKKFGNAVIPKLVIHYRDSTRNKRATPMFLFLFDVLQKKMRFDAKKVPILNLTAGYANSIH